MCLSTSHTAEVTACGVRQGTSTRYATGDGQEICAGRSGWRLFPFDVPATPSTSGPLIVAGEHDESANGERARTTITLSFAFLGLGLGGFAESEKGILRRGEREWGGPRRTQIGREGGYLCQRVVDSVRFN
jgi:hypothetical protein